MSSLSEQYSAEVHAAAHQAIVERDAQFANELDAVERARSLGIDSVAFLTEAGWKGDKYYSRPAELVAEYSPEQLEELARAATDSPLQRFEIISEFAAAFAGAKYPRGYRESKFEPHPRTREDYLEASVRLQTAAARELLAAHEPRGARPR